MARTIKGTIASSIDGNPLANALVKAFDSDVDGDDVMGEDRTDSNGRYSIGYRGGDWDPSPSSNVTIWRPDIYVKVFLPNNMGQLVQVKKSRTYDDHRLRNDLTIDLTVTPPLPTARTIHGLITDQTTGKPLPGALIRAFDRDPGGDQLMGEATSDSSGRYQIAYAGGHWDASPSHDLTVWRPDIYLQVFVKNVAGQYIQVKQTQEYSNQRLRESLQVDIPVTPRPYARTVRGTITWAGGGPVVGAAVWAYDSNELEVGGINLSPTGNRLMGEAVTDSTGSYLLTYAEGHWDPALHSVTTWRPDIFIDVDLGGYVWRSPVSDNVPHRDGCQISMQVEPPLLIFPFFSGANNLVKLWVGWFGVRAPEQLTVEYKEQGQTATKLFFSGTWRAVGKAKRRRFFCNTATIQVTPNKDYEVTAYIHVVQNLVGWATFRSLPATLSSLSSGQPFNILLGSCYYYEFDQGRAAARACQNCQQCESSTLEYSVRRSGVFRRTMVQFCSATRYRHALRHSD